MVLVMKPVNDEYPADKERAGEGEIKHDLWRSSRGASNDPHGRAVLGFFHLDARGERILEFVEMRDDQDLGKVMLYQIDRFYQPLAPLGILGAKAFVDDQSLKSRAFSLRKDLGQRQANGKVDAKC